MKNLALLGIMLLLSACSDSGDRCNIDQNFVSNYLSDLNNFVEYPLGDYDHNTLVNSYIRLSSITNPDHDKTSIKKIKFDIVHNLQTTSKNAQVAIWLNWIDRNKCTMNTAEANAIFERLEILKDHNTPYYELRDINVYR